MRKIALAALFGVLLFSGSLALNSASAASGPQCPNVSGIGSIVTSSIVSASTSAPGKTITYGFSSVNQSPSGGIPGLDDYCVYTSNIPPTVHSLSTFVAGSSSAKGYFGYGRSGGDPTNIPLDGTTGVIMGTATWATSQNPATQTIVLHINDLAECQKLYGGTSASCFVKPSTVTKIVPEFSMASISILIVIVAGAYIAIRQRALVPKIKF